MSSTKSIWQGRSFSPLWWSQFLSALNDNLFRLGLSAALTFGVIAVPVKESAVLVTISPALFILPYLIISGISGQLAEKYSRSFLLRVNRLIEIFVFGISSVALLTAQVPLLIVCLITVGALAAFYGPVKLAITPELVRPEQLIEANGAIEAGTYAAILLGTLVGTSLMSHHHIGLLWTVALILLVGVGAWVFSLLTPFTAPADPDLVMDWNVPRQSWDLIKWGAEDKLRTLLLLGNGWFWFVGTAVLSQLTLFVKDDLHSVPDLNTLFLALFAIGIGLGAWFCNFLLRGSITLQHCAAAALGMGLSALTFGLLAYAHPSAAGQILTLQQFLGRPWAWAMLVSVVLLAAFAGLFAVPIVTMMQTCVPDSQTGKLLSLSNIWFAVFVIAGAGMSLAIMSFGGHPKTIIAITGVLTLFVSAALFRVLPRESLKGFFSGLFRILYRVEVSGLEHLETAGKSVVIVANHQSLLDGALLAAFLPGDPIFAIDPIAASRWWARPLVNLVETCELNPLEPMSVRHLMQKVQQGRRCVIFPEGRLTETGGLMKVYPGPAVIAGKSNAPVVAVRMDGPQYTPFSYLRGVLPVRKFPKFKITVLPPEYAPNTDHLAGHERRAAMTRNLYDLMTRMVLRTQVLAPTIWDALIAGSKLYGDGAEVLEDARRNPMPYKTLITSSLAIGSYVSKISQPKEHVGVLLPTGTAAVITFFGLLSEGRVPAMLNFSAGVASLSAAVETAQIKTFVTAHEFVEKAHLEHAVEALSKKAKVLYLEDIRAKLTAANKLGAAAKQRFGYRSRELDSVNQDDPAVILFTSGSEGTPKAVALSHKNLLSNIEQVRSVIAYSPNDTFFNAMPMFHAFGLTGGVLVPVLHGTKSFLHPTPLQYRVIPELIYHSNATIVVGTDTFLWGWAKAANCYDFHSVRLIASGAERLRPETRQLLLDMFGVPIYEGYGVTECSPVAALNTPMFHSYGTVGRFLPNVEHRLEEVPGILKGRRLFLRGPNVMRGYLATDGSGSIQELPDGWYDTGDIVSVDENGYVTIIGRAKRFAKIGGEMVSLASVESYVSARWPQGAHAVVNVPDARKGEAIALVTADSSVTLDELSKFMRSKGAVELIIPKILRTIDVLPTLGNGKTDYVSIKQMVEREREANRPIEDETSDDVSLHPIGEGSR